MLSSTLATFAFLYYEGTDMNVGAILVVCPVPLPLSEDIPLVFSGSYLHFLKISFTEGMVFSTDRPTT